MKKKLLNNEFVKENKYLVVSVLIGTLFLTIAMLRVFQGIDVTDVGFYLSSYKLFFEAPEEIVYSQIYWFSNFIGSICYHAFSHPTLLSISICGFVFTLVLLVFGFTVLRGIHKNKRFVLTLLLLGFACSVPYTYVLNYNLLSLVTLGLSALAIVHAGQKLLALWPLFIAGVLLGIAVGCRFPNIIFLLVMLTWVGELKNFTKKVCTFIGGFSLALALQAAIVLFLKHEVYLKMAQDLIQKKALDNASTHSISKILLGYFGDIQVYISPMIVVIFVLAVAIRIPAHLQLKPTSAFRKALYMLISAIFCLWLVHYLREYNSTKMLLFLCFLALLGFTYHLKCRSSLVLLFFALSLSAGSNSGFFNSTPALCILLPWTILRFDMLKTSFPALSKKLPNYLLASLFLVLITKIITERFEDTYRDGPSPLMMTTQSNIPHLRGSYTSAERARILEEVFTVLSKLPADTSVIAYSDMPLLYFITNIKTPLMTVWPDLYEYRQFRYAFDDGVVKTGVRPYLLFNKLSLKVRDWPKNRRVPTERQQDQNFIFLKNYQKENNYNLFWENDFFELWKP